MPWYAFTGQTSFVADVPNAADAAAEARDTQTTAHGPYKSQAAAQSALGGKSPSGPAPSGTSGWFVIATTTAPTGTLHNPSGLTVQHFTGAQYTLALSWVPDGLAWGPYPTRAKADDELTLIREGKAPNPIGLPTNSPGSSTNPLSQFSLNASGFSEWFMRGLKILLGGILIVLGISRLTGAENAVTAAASKVKVIPV